MKQLEVQIMGQNYLLGCPPGGEARLLEAVERVDTAMCKIRDVGKVRARDRIAVVFGMLKGKNAADFLRELKPIAGSLNIVPIASPRSMPVSELAEIAGSQGNAVWTFLNADEALVSLRDLDVDLIVVTGSLALAAEARVALGLAQPEVIPHAL